MQWQQYFLSLDIFTDRAQRDEGQWGGTCSLNTLSRCLFSQIHISPVVQVIQCAIKIAYYQQAKNPSLPETLQACAHAMGLDVKIFIEDLSPAMESELQRQMQQARSMDVYSYPSLRLVHNDTVFPVAVDYLDHRTMLDEIKNNRVSSGSSLI